jgi:hypothetical protein
MMSCPGPSGLNDAVPSKSAALEALGLGYLGGRTWAKCCLPR